MAFPILKDYKQLLNKVERLLDLESGSLSSGVVLSIGSA